MQKLSLAVVAFFALTLFAARPAWAQQLKAEAPAAPKTVEEKRKTLEEVERLYWEDLMKSDPEWASELGDKRYNDKIADYSVKAANEQLAREQNYMMQLLNFDPAGLSGQERTSYALLVRQFAQDQDAEEFKEWEFSVNQMGGVHAFYPQLAAQLTFATAKDYDDWTARLRQLPRAFEQVSANLAMGMDEHRTPPRYLMEKTLVQVKELGGQKAEDSPLALPLKSFPAAIGPAERERIKTEMLEAIGKEALPAYLRFARFLEVSYIPACRTEPGIAAMPGGARYYSFLIERETTTRLTAAQLHQIGLDEVARDEAEMLTIAKSLGYADVKSLRAAMKTNPKLKPASAEALLEAYRGYLKPMQARLPEMFGRLPKQPFEVAAVPEFLAKDAPPAYYQPGSSEAGRPGRLEVNLSQIESRSLAPVEAVAYHEGLPGHHLQIALAQEMEGLPAFRKHGAGEATAFVEGWALYSERLGKEMGFYQNPFSDYGRLDADIWRAIRLVVDTGVHSQHWTRQQMVDYFHEHSGLDEPTIQAEVDRYIAWPGQALAYKTGQLTILALRERAKKELGAKFDLRGFHDVVLGSGALPLDLLEANVDAWIASRK